MKVSFDFDGTLAHELGQRRAKGHIERGDDVYITTARPKDWRGDQWDNTVVFETAKKVGIPEKNIRFTDFDEKWKYLTDFNIHFDDNELEIEQINSKTDCKGVLVKYT